MFGRKLFIGTVGVVSYGVQKYNDASIINAHKEPVAKITFAEIFEPPYIGVDNAINNNHDYIKDIMLSGDDCW